METRVFESKFNVFRASKPLTKEQMKGCKGGDYGDGDYGDGSYSSAGGCYDCICKGEPDQVYKRRNQSDCEVVCAGAGGVKSDDACSTDYY